MFNGNDFHDLVELLIVLNVDSLMISSLGFTNDQEMIDLMFNTGINFKSQLG